MTARSITKRVLAGENIAIYARPKDLAQETYLTVVRMLMDTNHATVETNPTETTIKYQSKTSRLKLTPTIKRAPKTYTILNADGSDRDSE